MSEGPAPAPPVGADGPPIDVPEPDEVLVRRLVDALPASVRALLDPLDPLGTARDRLPVEFVSRGWDNAVWRVGSAHAARIPIRNEAVALLANEARWAAAMAAPMVRLGAAVSLPVHLSPAGAHPYPWLLTTWVTGTLLEDVPVAGRAPLAEAFAAVLPALHRPAPAAAPLNVHRGIDLTDLPEIRPEVAAGARALLGAAWDVVHDAYAAGRAAARWPGPRVWCHGDLHPRNLLLRREDPTSLGPAARLGVLDHGDLTSGDPATDLAVLWLALDAPDRDLLRASLADAYDPAALIRARAWAARFVIGVAGVYPVPFRRTIEHTVAQLLAEADGG